MDKQQDWKKVLKADPTDKLLEKLEHLDRYYLLREIMGKPEDDAEVSKLRNTLVMRFLTNRWMTAPGTASRMTTPTAPHTS